MEKLLFCISFFLSVAKLYAIVDHKWQVGIFNGSEQCCFEEVDSGEFTKAGSKYYLLRKDKVSWIQAVMECRKVNSNIAAIESIEEMEAITKFFLKNHSTFSEWIWVGATDQDNEGIFRWISNGKDVMTDLWSVNEPNNAFNGEDCANIWPAVVNNRFNLNDNHCTGKLAFLCERIAPQMLTLTVWE